jgi:chemotaxis protein MotB
MILSQAQLGRATLAAALLLGGCVTQGSYDKLEAEKQQQVGELQAQRTALEQKLGELQSQRQALEQEKRALEGDQKRLQAENQELARQREQLMSASRQSQQQYDQLVENLNQEVQKGQLQVRRYKDMLTVDVAEQLFFDSGSATLKQGGKDVLKKVAEAMKRYEDKAIRVVGHTDNVPIAGGLKKVFPTNWELSAARATTVVRFLQDQGIEPERLIATGRAQYAPIASNDTEEGRRRNRRIEITLIDRNLLQEERANP